MKIIKEEIKIEESLKQKLEVIFSFVNTTPTFRNGSIRKIDISENRDICIKRTKDGLIFKGVVRYEYYKSV